MLTGVWLMYLIRLSCSSISRLIKPFNLSDFIFGNSSDFIKSQLNVVKPVLEKTPSGKIEVTVKDPKTGNEVTKVWNKATKVTVKKDKLVERAMMSVTPGGPGSLRLEGELNEYDESDWGYKLGEWFLDTFPEKAARFFKTYSDEDPGEYVQRLGNQLVNMFLVGGSMVGLGASVTYNSLKDKIKAKFGRSNSNLSEAKKKKLTADEANPSELRMGIKVEMEHTDDLDKAKKIALDHLAENPFYYTALKLAGVESSSVPKAKYPVAFKKEVTAAVELVDKINAMKPVKGVEKAKASSP